MLASFLPLRSSRHARASERPATHARSPLFMPVAIVLSAWVIFGGAAPESLLLFTALAISGTVMIGLLVWRAGAAPWGGLSLAAKSLIGFVLLVPLVQLLPLPPGIWQALPGRELAVETLSAVGRADTWRPLTLAVEPTFRTLLVLVWLVALMLATMQLPTDDLRRLFGLLLILGLLNVAIGVVQVVSNNELLVFHKGFEGRFLTGLFANKNHTGLFIAMTYLFGFGALYGKRGWSTRNLPLVVSVGLVLLIALLATFSRAGMLFGLAAIGFITLLARRGPVTRRVRHVLIGAAVIGLILLVVVLSTDVASRSIGRFSGVGSDQRWSIWRWSWPLVGLYFPVGSGVGSFTMVFPPHEQLDWVRATYVNHVHNDYLEQLIEMGIAAPVGWLLVILALWRPLRAAWAERERQSGRLALLGGAALFFIAVHSLFDYPLRRPAISAAAMIALAAVLRFEATRSRLHGSEGYAKQGVETRAG